MAEFYFPGGDGKWDALPMPETLEAAHDRIDALQKALAFYADCRSYNPESMDNEAVSHKELLADKGLNARIGRLATSREHFNDWHSWAYVQDRRY